MIQDYDRKQLLMEYQAMPLEAKIMMSVNRIHEFYTGYGSSKGYGNCYVSFSGGKDSTVLLDLVRRLYPDVKGVFVNTGLEYPEIQSFVYKQNNIDIIRPRMSFIDVITRYGYPLISKEVAEAIRVARKIKQRGYKERTQRREELTGVGGHYYSKHKWLPLVELPIKISGQCCNIMKKETAKHYGKNNHVFPFVGTLAEESKLRRTEWLRSGCNSFSGKIISRPLSFWTEQDILEYIKTTGINISAVYGKIEGEPGNLKCSNCERTGCIYCGFGVHIEKGKSRFQKLMELHPRGYEYCMNGGQWVNNADYDESISEYEGKWHNWNPKALWVPSDKGLGLKRVFDWINEIYGKNFIKYE